MREIARRLGISRTSAAKYAELEGFSPAPKTRPAASMLTGVVHLIEQRLGEDAARRPRRADPRAFRPFNHHKHVGVKK